MADLAVFVRAKDSITSSSPVSSSESLLLSYWFDGREGARLHALPASDGSSPPDTPVLLVSASAPGTPDFVRCELGSLTGMWDRMHLVGVVSIRIPE